VKIAVLPFLFFSLFLSLSGCASLGGAQTAEVEPAAGISGKKIAVESDFPQWVKDLRRAEIVAFGSFPFTMFTATFAMDAYRWVAHGGGISEEARKYAPWPFKGAGAVDMSNDEHKITMAAAAAASVTIALLDCIIIQAKRYKARERVERMPPGTPIIIRTPAASGPDNIPGPDNVPGADNIFGADAGSPENGEDGEDFPPGGASAAEGDGVPAQAPGNP
jgi:hypothetical protein